MENPNKDNRYFEAKERVAAIKKFYTSLFFYVVFIAFLAGLNYYVDRLQNPWFLWAALGWGIGIIFHAFKAFRFNLGFGKDWEDRKLKQYMEEEDRKKGNRWN